MMNQNKNNKRFLKCFLDSMVILIFLGLNIFLVFSISISGSLYGGYSEHGSSAPYGRYLGYGFLGYSPAEYTGFPYGRNPGYGLFATPYNGYSGQIPFDRYPSYGFLSATSGRYPSFTYDGYSRYGSLGAPYGRYYNATYWGYYGYGLFGFPYGGYSSVPYGGIYGYSFGDKNYFTYKAPQWEIGDWWEVEITQCSIIMSVVDPPCLDPIYWRFEVVGIEIAEEIQEESIEESSPRTKCFKIEAINMDDNSSGGHLELYYATENLRLVRGEIHEHDGGIRLSDGDDYAMMPFNIPIFPVVSKKKAQKIYSEALDLYIEAIEIEMKDEKNNVQCIQTWSISAPWWIFYEKKDTVKGKLLNFSHGDKLSNNGNPQTITLPHLMKGYELYSWQEKNEWFFALLPGTNRLKSYDEIISVREGIDSIKETLSKLPKEEDVSWIGENWLKQVQGAEGNFRLPNENMIDEIKMFCEQLGIDLQICNESGSLDIAGIIPFLVQLL